MADHIIAVDTYGSQRVTAPQTGKTVSAYKMGYTSAVAAVLLALYGTNARDVSPKQASYHYVQIDGEVVVRHGHILLTLTADELTKTEQIARQSHRAGVYLWRYKKWWAFPDSSHADYDEPSYRAGPTFDPTGFRPPSPSTGERETTISGIHAEKSQRSSSEKPWWWLSGETYPHRDLLKRSGARFSSRRKQWYWIGAELPAAIRALVTSEAEMDDGEPAVEITSPLLAIFGGRITGKERASNGDLLLCGENGIFATRITWVNRDDQPETVWEFDLPSQNRVGNPLPAMQQALQTNQAVYSLYTRKWHFEQTDRVAALDALAAAVPFSDDTVQPDPVGATAASMTPELTAMIETALAADDAETPARTPDEPLTEAPPPAIRVMKPATFPADGEPLDAVQTAIRAVKASPHCRTPQCSGRPQFRAYGAD